MLSTKHIIEEKILVENRVEGVFKDKICKCCPLALILTVRVYVYCCEMLESGKTCDDFIEKYD